MEILNITYKAPPKTIKFKGKFQEADPINRNPPNRFLQEAIECEKRWAETGLLDAIKEPFVRQMVAAALENQMHSKPGRANKAQSCRTVKLVDKNEKSV